MFKTKRDGLRPWELLRCHRAPRRPYDAIKSMLPLRHRQVIKSYPRRNNHALLASLTGNQSCTLPFLTSRELPLRHWQIKRSCPVLQNNNALLASLTGSQSWPLPFLTSRKLPLRHWQIKRSYPVLHLPRNRASRIKQTDLSVRLKGQHRRGSAPMFINTAAEARLCRAYVHNNEHRHATAVVSPPSHAHRYARRASFSKCHTSTVLPEPDLISVVPLAKHRARKSSGP